MSSLDSLRDLAPEAVAALAAIAAFLVVLAIGVQLAAARLRHELVDAGEAELVDPTTGLLPRAALPVQLGAELAWGGVSGTPISVAALRIRGSRFLEAVGVLRHEMREEEQAFTLGEQRIAVELWGADPDAAVLATRRLGRALAAAGHPVVDAGVACAPRDAVDPATLVDIALRDLRPVDDPIAPGDTLAGTGAALGRSAHAMRLLIGVLPWFIAFCVLIAACWRLLPGAIEPALGSSQTGSRTSAEWTVALVTMLGIPLAAACAVVASWNAAAGGAPRSHPLARAGARAGALVFAAVAVPLTWAILAPDPVGSLPAAFGAQLAMLALIVLTLFAARQFVHIPIGAVVALAALGAATVWAGVELDDLPALADVGRLLLAASLGALLARFVERASWLAGLALLAGAVDLWSVFAESGLTRNLLESEGASDDLIVQLVLFQGPTIGGTELFAIGTTDLVFVAIFLAWSHDWRLDLRIVTPVLIAALWFTSVAVYWFDQTLPALPALAAAMLLVLGIRSWRLRGRVASWQGEQRPQ